MTKDLNFRRQKHDVIQQAFAYLHELSSDITGFYGNVTDKKLMTCSYITSFLLSLNMYQSIMILVTYDIRITQSTM